MTDAGGVLTDGRAERGDTLLIRPEVADRVGGVVLPRPRVAWDTPTLRLPRVTDDPFDVLVERVRPRLDGAVDALQVAAFLESDGITDSAAETGYGYADAFALAEDVYRRLRRTAPRPVAVTDAATPATRPAGDGGLAGRRRAAVRDIAHGGLYLLPTSLFPAALVALAPTGGSPGGVQGGGGLPTGAVAPLGGAEVAVLVAAGWLGWVWSGGGTWLAYQLLGRGRPASASRLLRWSALAALPVVAATAFVVALTGAAGLTRGVGLAGAATLMTLAVGQMAYQMAAALAMFGRDELLFAVTMAPAAGLGALFVLTGHPSAAVAAGSGGACVAVGLAGMVWRTRQRGAGPAEKAGLAEKAGPEPGLRSGVRPYRRELAWVGCSTALCAAVLLYAEVPYLTDDFGILLGALPLFAGMGLVEWRARRLSERARGWLAQVAYPAVFARRVRTALVVEVATSVAMLAALAVPVLIGVRALGLDSPAAVVMTAAHVTVGGAYLLAFLLTGYRRYGWLCAGLVSSLIVHAVAALALAALRPGWPAALQDTTAFLVSVVLLLAVLLAGLINEVGQVWRHR